MPGWVRIYWHGKYVFDWSHPRLADSRCPGASPSPSISQKPSGTATITKNRRITIASFTFNIAYKLDEMMGFSDDIFALPHPQSHSEMNTKTPLLLELLGAEILVMIFEQVCKEHFFWLSGSNVNPGLCRSSRAIDQFETHVSTNWPGRRTRVLSPN